MPKLKITIAALIGVVIFGINSFTVANANLTPLVNLGSAATYSALGYSGVNAGITTDISGDLGISPGALTGTSFTIGGAKHVADVAAATAMADLQNAYDDAFSRTVTAGLIAGDLAGQTLTPGVHSSGTAAITLSTNLTLDGLGDPDSVFIIKIGGALSTAATSSITLINGANADNIFWAVAGAASTGAGASFAGTILANGAISLGDATVLNGRVLSSAALSMTNSALHGVPFAPLNPTFNSPIPTTDDFRVLITNYSRLFSWAGTVSSGGFTISSISASKAVVTITGLAPATSSTLTITTTRTGFFGGSTSVTATSIPTPIPIPTSGPGLNALAKNMLSNSVESGTFVIYPSATVGGSVTGQALTLHNTIGPQFAFIKNSGTIDTEKFTITVAWAQPKTTRLKNCPLNTTFTTAILCSDASIPVTIATGIGNGMELEVTFVIPAGSFLPISVLSSCNVSCANRPTINSSISTSQIRALRITNS